MITIQLFIYNKLRIKSNNTYINLTLIKSPFDPKIFYNNQDRLFHKILQPK